MHTSAFLKLFPPPKFLVMQYAGLDISDDAIRCLEYGRAAHGLSIAKYAKLEMPAGLFDGGDIKDEKQLASLLSEFDHAHDLSYVKVSLPEEKAYLFETDIEGTDIRSIQQHIEFKLEENVPLSAADAVFYFDLIKPRKPGDGMRASVSVVPRSYIERYIALLRGAGIFPVAFEIAPRALARALLPQNMNTTELIVHVMKHKTGMYVVSNNIVSFTSTIVAASDANDDAGRTSRAENIAKEAGRIQAYWLSKGIGSAISTIRLVGEGAAQYEKPLGVALSGSGITVQVADVWKNAFSIDHYVPPVSKEESLEYAVAAGLGLSL